MFTGLIKSVGKISSLSKNAEGVLIKVTDPVISKNVAVDDSVSINGACQTVVAFDEHSFQVQAVHTTIEKTTFKNFKAGDCVNLELALRLSDRLGGHLVQGHVNGVGKVLNWDSRGDNYVVSFEVPKDLMRYIVKEGSITINGISLTVSELDRHNCQAQVSIIPHTWNNTTFATIKKGEDINLEVDILAKYVENLLFHGGKTESSVEETGKNKITEDWLKSQGFWN